MYELVFESAVTKWLLIRGPCPSDGKTPTQLNMSHRHGGACQPVQQSLQYVQPVNQVQQHVNIYNMSIVHLVPQ